MRRFAPRSLALFLSVGLLSLCGAAEMPEYDLKAAFLYNFAQFTEWPEGVGHRLTLCTYGGDPFGKALEDLEGKPVGGRTLLLRRRVPTEALAECEVLYVSREAIASLPAVRKRLAARPVLIVADSPGAASSGATLNMTVTQSRISFEANRRNARESGLDLSSRLLRLATEVIQ